MTDEEIKKAAKIVKILYLAGLPGMDEVAVKLNSNPTYAEVLEARKWAIAFELAKRQDTAYALAAILHKEIRL